MTVSGDLAVAHSIDHMNGTKPAEETPDDGLWFRATIVFARRDGRWVQIHEHESVPFAMDGSFRALVDLTP